jgi:hypothetical protein
MKLFLYKSKWQIDKAVRQLGIAVAMFEFLERLHHALSVVKLNG